MMTKGDVRIAFGIMGGFNQAQAHAQFVSNVVDHGMNIQAAMEAPRFSKASFAGCDLYVEARVPAAVLSGLAKLGHQPQLVGDVLRSGGRRPGGDARLPPASTTAPPIRARTARRSRRCRRCGEPRRAARPAALRLTAT